MAIIQYIIEREAYYFHADNPIPDDPGVTIQLRDGSGKLLCEFRIAERWNTTDRPNMQLKMFDDSWRAFTDIPLFFEILSRLTNPDVKMMVSLLDHLGATDITERVRPLRSEEPTSWWRRG